MTCENTDWRFKFDTRREMNALEVRPISMDLELSRFDYDYCRSKFPPEVGEVIKPYTRKRNGIFNKLIRVRIFNDEDKVHSMVCRPDYIRFGNDATHIELHDLQESLSNGLVNMKREVVTLRNVYNDVFDQAVTSLVSGPEFQDIPDDTPTEIWGTLGDSDYEPPGDGGVDFGKRFKEDNSKKLIDSKFAVDFENISPERAIHKLNKLYGLQSWVTRNGVLKIGNPSRGDSIHFAAPDDERVWRYEDVSVTHGREPIRKVMVMGAWIDEPGWGGFDEAVDEVASFINNDDQGKADARIVGIAERQDIHYGKTVFMTADGAKKDGVTNTAVQELRNRMMDTHSGSVEINAQLSGEQVSNLIDIYPGDTIRMVPDDSYFDNPTADSGNIFDTPPRDEICGRFVNNEQYLITGVTHEVEGSNWTISTDIGLNPRVPIDTRITYYNPDNNEFISKSEFDFDGSNILNPKEAADNFFEDV